MLSSTEKAYTYPFNAALLILSIVKSFEILAKNNVYGFVFDLELYIDKLLHHKQITNCCLHCNADLTQIFFLVL